MRRPGPALALGLALLAAPAGAGVEAASRTFPGPFERVWRAVEAGLRQQGWRVDHADAALGLLVTASRRLAGDDDGLQARTRRVRLRVQVVPVAADRTAVTVVPEHFVRDRVLWVHRDEPVLLLDAALAPEPGLARRVLAAVGAAL